MEDSGDDEGMMGIVVPCADAAAALQKIAAAAAASRATSRTMLGGRKTELFFFITCTGPRGTLNWCEFPKNDNRQFLRRQFLATGLILERGRSYKPALTGLCQGATVAGGVGGHRRG